MSNAIYKQYESKLPKELVDSTRNVYAEGLIRLCNPDTYLDILADGYHENNAIIFATTAFGDFLVWEKDKYVNLVSFSQHKVIVLESGFEFFFQDICDQTFLKEYFRYELFLAAKKEIGDCKADECFTSIPIPYIDGNMKVEKIKIGKLREYNALSIELAGKLM